MGYLILLSLFRGRVYTFFILSWEAFSRGDGRLHFDPIPFVAITGNEKLTSTEPFGPRFFSLEFYDFSSTNLQPPASHQGAFVALGLTDGTNFVRIMRDQNGINGTPVGVFEVNYNIGPSILVHYVETEATQGKLGNQFLPEVPTFNKFKKSVYIIIGSYQPQNRP
jgi:hypothetical protein